MPTLIIDGHRCCPKCARRIGRKNKGWPLLLCKTCIKWEANRGKYEERMDNRLKGGAGLSKILLKYQQTPAPELVGPAMLKQEDLPLEAKEFIRLAEFSADRLEALSQPWGHAVYKEQVKAEEEEGRRFQHVVTSHNARRDSVIDKCNSGSSSADLEPIDLDDSRPQIRDTAPPKDELWHRAMSPPCSNCVREQSRHRLVDHALADCPCVIPAIRMVIQFRLRQAGYHVGEEDSHLDDKRVMKDHQAAGSTLGGRKRKKKGFPMVVRAIFRNSVQTPCLSCDKRGLQAAEDHSLIDCTSVEGAQFRKAQKKFKNAFVFVDRLLAPQATSAQSPDHGSSVEAQVSAANIIPGQVSQPQSWITNNTSEANWQSNVLDEVLHMEMTARPSSLLEAAHIVRKELESRLMDDVMTGDPTEGTPVSIPLLEELSSRISSLQRAAS